LTSIALATQLVEGDAQRLSFSRRNISQTRLNPSHGFFAFALKQTQSMIDHGFSIRESAAGNLLLNKAF
jgi:hypothetical protein